MADETTDPAVLAAEEAPTAPRWRLYTGSGTPPGDAAPRDIPLPPPWRRPRHAGAADPTRAASFLVTPGDAADTRGTTYRPSHPTIEMVNAALYLGRPLLITGKPGTGKSSLAHSVARELGLGPVLRWNINSRSTLREGLYEYDALRRLADHNLNKPRPVGEYITLGPLGTALLPWARPRVLLIDEIDKGDIDLPNDLLNVFEEGEFFLREAASSGSDDGEGGGADGVGPLRVLTFDAGQPLVTLPDGPRVRVAERFPVVFLTSNGERDFPPAFLRRCLRLYLLPPDEKHLMAILESHFAQDPDRATFVGDNHAECLTLVREFLTRTNSGNVLATDQLLNAVYLTVRSGEPVDDPEAVRRRLREALLMTLHSGAELNAATTAAATTTTAAAGVAAGRESGSSAA